MEGGHKLETCATTDKGGRGGVADTVAAALGTVERKELVGAAGVLLGEGDVVARKAGADADAKVVDGAARGARAVGRAHEGVGRERAEARLARRHVAHRTAVGLFPAIGRHHSHQDTHKNKATTTITATATRFHPVL